ncbi:MAG: alpha-xylosidase [Defluviitaleaceae bacterium]|nr:alpha-xylosidase [Defluviitaleaceae bacterium]
MKFTDGYWMLKQGNTAFPCIDVRDVKIFDDRIILYIAPQKIFNRGQTLDGPLFTMEITAPQMGVLQITANHHFANEVPNFPIKHAKLPLSTEKTEETLTIKTGKLTAIIQKCEFSITYFWDDKFLTTSKPRQMAYMTTNDGNFWRERLQTSVGEQYYGFGERFTPFVKNGQSIDIWNEDGGTASEQAYKNVPFCISNKGYGVFVNDTGKVSFEVCSEVVSKLQFSVAGETLNYMIVGGDSLADVLSQYSAILGKPALPPAWSYGLWLSTSFTTDYSEETVNSFIDGMFSRDIPISVFHFDCFWMKEYEWCSFSWDLDAFPEPENMLKRLKNKGLKICVWINPYIGQKSPLFAEAAENGYFIKRTDGKIWQWNKWQPGMGIVDFTNPRAVEWYQSHLKRLMSQGVDAFKTDFGERIPLDVEYFDGSNPEKMHNYYAYLYNKAVFDVLPKEDAVLFARSATAGCQQFPVHWGGDCEATYESMAESLRGGLSLAVCGFGFWSHDIGGFEHTATPDLYKRWVAFGLFSTHSRLHGSMSYRVPWLFDEEAVDVLRFFTKQKHALMPYIYAQSVKAHETGIPIMRPMVVDFQNDPVCANLDTQYMFGDSFLVAPVFNTDGTTNVFLPILPLSQSRWTNWLTNEQQQGGQFVEESHDYFSLGLWVQPNSVIAVGKTDNSAVYDYENDVTLHVFLEDYVVTKVYDNNGNLAIEVEFTAEDDQILVAVKKSVGAFSLLFRGMQLTSDEVPCKPVELGTAVEVSAKLDCLALNKA